MAPASAVNGRDAAVERLQRAYDAQHGRIAELEARLALLENEARVDRGPTTSKLSETVTLGKVTRRAQVPAEAQPLSALDPSAPEPAPLRLRLYGRPAETASSMEQEPLPVVDERLSVAPLPAASSHGERGGGTLKTPFKTRYLAALRLLRERHYSKARSAFVALQSDFPDHRLADNVTYWLGEVAYAQRDYDAAVRAFESVIQRFPDSDKLPEALFKAGLSHRQKGEKAAASKYLTRVRSEFPDSEVARLASAEGSR